MLQRFRQMEHSRRDYLPVQQRRTHSAQLSIQGAVIEPEPVHNMPASQVAEPIPEHPRDHLARHLIPFGNANGPPFGLDEVTNTSQRPSHDRFLETGLIDDAQEISSLPGEHGGITMRRFSALDARNEEGRL